MTARTPYEFAQISQVVTTPQSFFAANKAVSVDSDRRISTHASAKRGPAFFRQGKPRVPVQKFIRKFVDSLMPEEHCKCRLHFSRSLFGNDSAHNLTPTAAI
jgi:hypothetical protein